MEDLGRICKTLAKLGRPDAPAACTRTTSFAGAIPVEPSHAFPRAFLAAAWTDMGAAYETLAGCSTASAADRRAFGAAALDRHRRSSKSDPISARGAW